MPFDLTAWRAEVRALVADFARDPQGTLRRAGVDSLYGFLLGSTMLPLAAAYAHEPTSAISALIGVTGSLGANLLANLAQRKYDHANALATVATEAQSPELMRVYESIARAIDLVPLAEAALTQASQADALSRAARRAAAAGQGRAVRGRDDQPDPERRRQPRRRQHDRAGRRYRGGRQDRQR